MQFGGLSVPLGDLEPIVRQMLAPSVERDPCESLDDVIADIESGQAIAWLISDGASVRGVVVTQILEGSKAKQLFIRHVAGEGVADWLHFLETIETWARSIGCQTIELIGREGWERLLGWNRQAVLLRKDLRA
jgi:hypothetical protein